VAAEGHTHVVIGAGSAGCTLAARLTEDPDTRVLLLEAGPWDRDPRLRIPLAWPHIFLRQVCDWGYWTEPEPAMGGRPIEFARGKVVGGSSSTNAMAYVRGCPADYDRWAAMGLAGWSFAELLPYFRRQESWEGGADAWRGGDGPLATRFCRLPDPLGEAFLAAASAAGHRLTADYNGAAHEGFGRWQMTVRNGRRCSAADAYLRPALRRAGGRLRVRTGALATRILFEGPRAVGVEYRHRGALRVARADGEVILAGGAVNSPQLLMLSGIGDPEALARHGIPCRLPLGGVGRNLQDHISAAVVHRRRGQGPVMRGLRADRIARDLLRCWLFGTGLASEFVAPVMGFVRTAEALAAGGMGTAEAQGLGARGTAEAQAAGAMGPVAAQGAVAAIGQPDIQYFLVAAPMDAGPWLRPFVAPAADGFATRAVLLHPESRGCVSLASADPAAAPRLVQNFLATARDRRTLRAGLRLAREIGRQAPLAGFVAGEAAPGDWSDAGLDAHIAATGITAHHPVGTCRMGVDEGAVVDAALRVRGADGLRVVDASVMPDLIGGNTNAAVIMIAEKAADLIRGRPPLPAAPG